MAIAPTGSQAPSSPDSNQNQPGLRRELPFSGALALSVGIMAPTAALALNGAGAAANAGRAVPLVFLLGAIGVGFVSYAFIRMSRYVSHAGSMYGFTGVALGPRPALGVGWTLFGTYVMLAATGCAGCAVFVLNLFGDLGILGGLGWIPVVIVVYLLAGAIGYGQMRRATRVLLVAEGISIVMVTILFVLIFVKLFAGTAPNHASFSLKPFSPGPGVSTSALFLGIVFAFLSFAGFEGAATLGEETNDPKRNIGRAIGGTLILGGALFVVGMLAETLGFGIGTAGVKAFAGSSAPLGDLAHSYVGQWYRDLVDLGAALSMFAATIGGTAAAGRMLYVLGRNGLGPSALAQASPKTGSPWAAVAVCVAFGLLSLLYMGIQGATDTDAFFYAATLGTLGLLVAYIMTNLSAFRFLILARRRPPWEGVFPVAGTIFLGYVLWKQVYPVPAYPYNLFPYVDLVFVIVGCLYLCSRSSIVDRARADVDGLKTDARVVTAGPYFHAGEVDVVGPTSAAEETDARVL
ncbi:MAG: APC family permease [Actinomycetota bacterium]|nr:APC family permease [Actinomycetota bacterium]